MQTLRKTRNGLAASARATNRRHVMLMIDPPIPARFEGIGRFAREHGWRLTLANRLVRAPRGWDGDGALVTLGGKDGLPFEEALKQVAEATLPADTYIRLNVRLGVGELPGPDWTDAARHFLDIGLKRAIWFSTEWSNAQALFCKGLEEGMEAEPTASHPGVAGTMRRIILSRLLPRSRLDDPDRFAAVLAPRLRALPKPIGILAYNDEEAARVSALCLDIGIQIPEEAAILGIGNDAFLCENQAVPISSVIDNLERNGYEGAALLDRLMDGAPAPDTPVVVPCGGVCARRSTDTFAAESPVLRQAVRLLTERLDHPPGIDRIAQLTGVSRATLDRLFLRELGRPPHAELLRRRLARARELLRDTDLPAAEISAQCGFCNPAAFSAAFARAEGLPPGKWRKSAT